MNKKITYIASTLLLTTLLFVSCTNIFSHKNSVSSKSDADGKTYLCLKVNNSREASRSLAPKNTQPFDITAFTDFSLIGKLEGEEGKTLFEADTYDDIPQKIEIMSGQWTFYLYAKYNNIEFTADQTLYILSGQQNNITLTLRPFEQFGGCDISFTLTDSVVSKVEVTLKRSSDGEIILDKSPLQILEKNGAKTVSLKRSMASEEERLTSGRYYAKFDFYIGEGGTKGYALLNEFESFLIITDAFTTSANISLDFNELYTISYHYLDDQYDEFELVDANDFAPGSNSFIPFYYSKGSEILLPKLKKSGKLFIGWKNYNGHNFDSDIIEKIETDRTGNLYLTAEFIDTDLYVSMSGDDTSGFGLKNYPFETIEKACEFIVEFGRPEADWTIYIDGEATGKSTSTSDTDPYGRSIIPADVTTDYANSILLMGCNDPGVDSEGHPKPTTDKLNRGLPIDPDDTDKSKPDGAVLVIATQVPVTIKNLIITGGNTWYSEGSDVYSSFGGGLHIVQGANVTLDDGVLITENAGRYGGAIYNAGTLTMVGSATIGDKSVNTFAQIDHYSNYYSNGGGIYNVGTVYLGSTKTLTGGIYNSYGKDALGGGIFNDGNGTIEMCSGNINYNDGQEFGGGVYLNTGTFTMTEGQMIGNSTGKSGGAVYVKNATFYFSGGVIKGHNANTSGGAIFIEGANSNNIGKMFMYGSAVIGDSTKTSMPPVIESGTTNQVIAAMSEGCNVAPLGAAIYTTGELYLGYSSPDVKADLNGGIYYNTAKGTSKGGALYIPNTSYGKVFMNSGTIAYNYASMGGAVYLVSSKFTIGGTASIPAGYASKASNDTVKQDIYFASDSYTLQIDGVLEKVADTVSENSRDQSICVVPDVLSNGAEYDTYHTVIALTSSAKTDNVTLNDVHGKFSVKPITNPSNGIVTSWIIGTNGKPKQNTVTLYVSASGSSTNQGTSGSPLDSINTAVSKMNNPDVDYIINVSGEIKGPQTIADASSQNKIKANSITIKGTSGSSNDIPKTCLNADLGANQAGTALTVNTAVPVTLQTMTIKGGHGTITGEGTDSKIIGGGLLLGANALVYLDNYTNIRENTTYITGNTSPGYGAGVYISSGAKLYENSYCRITENVGTVYGAGVYIADGGSLQTMAGSGSFINSNTFNTDFKDSNGNAVIPCGGAVYIADNGTHEMFGAWFRDNCKAVNNCLGSGIYLSATGNLKVKGHTEVVIPNDVYMKSGAQIEIVDTLDPNNPSNYSGPIRTARLTPETYTAGTPLVKAASGLSNSTFTNALKYFEITSQEVLYWSLNNSGQLVQKVGTGITVTIPNGVSNDMQVTIQEIDGEVVQTIEPGTHITGGKKLTFTAPDGYESYKWTIDGEEESTNISLGLDTRSWTVGVYVVYLEAKEYDDVNDKYIYHSYTAQIKVGSF